MVDGIKVYWLEPLDRERRSLRRYRHSAKGTCPGKLTYCHAMTPYGDADIRYTVDGYVASDSDKDKPPPDDPRWPTKCEACGEPFTADDPYQLFGRQLYVRPDTGEVMTTEDAPPGACWDAWWIKKRRRDQGDCPTGCGYHLGDDRRSLVVKCPDGRTWMIDSRASNCTMPSDKTHHCWVRHGKPEEGTLHVDKNGNTCKAGAGSIDTGTWHGFLHNGELRS